MSTLTLPCVISALALLALLPLQSKATQIATNAGQFTVQAKLVQNSCVPEIRQNMYRVNVRLHYCDTLSPSLSAELSAEKQNIRTGLPVKNTSTTPEKMYSIDIQGLSSMAVKPELMIAVLQLTYL